MSKKISKLLLSLLLIVVTLSSFSVSFAEVDGDKTKALTTSETQGEAVTTGETKESNATANQEIHSGDLYIFDTDVVMDKLVDGNVFIFGTNVEITGQVNGSLFVFADTIKFDQSYIRYSVFACANSVYYNAACNDLYVATNDLEMTYDSIVYRDLKSVSSDVILKAAVGRDVDLICDTVSLGESEDIPIIYGSLRYTANNEIEIPEGVISGDGTVTYTKPSELDGNTASSIVNILVGFFTSIVTVLVIYAITKKCTPNFSEKLANQKLTPKKVLKAFGLGLGSIILVTIAFIILLATSIGVNLAFILALLFIVLCLLAVPALTIIITNLLKPAFKIEKTSMFCLILALVSIVLHGITLIHAIGEVLGFIITMVAIGLLIDMYLPHKELTDEEKAAIEEAKQKAKEMKESRKQEKLEAKEAKKQTKLEAKEAKKENKE